MCLDCDSGAAFVRLRLRLRFPLKKKKILRSTFHVGFCLSVGLVHYAWDLRPL